MLRESYLNKEDKNISSEIESRKYNLFSELNMTDADYYKEYPTIYHLRNKLVNNDEKLDIRLVYLAVHHIMKYRGNFLHDGDFSITSAQEVVGKLKIILEFLEKNYDITLKTENSKVFNILQNNNTIKSEKKEELMKLFDYDITDKNVVKNVVNSILGNSFELNKIFNTDLEKDKFTFSKEIEDEDALINNLGENQEVYTSLKDIYSWYILQDILKGKSYISKAFIEKYDEYSKDLNLLKKVYKIYLAEKYNDMFRKNKENNYYAYNGKNSKKCTIAALYTTIKNDLKEISDGINEKKIILSKIAEETFLQKLNTTDNAAIPYQLHLLELEKILENQSKYYKGIEENRQNIRDLFTFRIPYYVGTFCKAENPKWGWVVRKNDENIRPWNFSEVVDEEATAEEFIRRVTNKCTYLLCEDVMSKNSLLYSEFCVLNELNNVKYTYKSVGRMSGKTFKTDKLLKMTFIYSSVTGMLEERYKIDGMENSGNN